LTGICSSRSITRNWRKSCRRRRPHRSRFVAHPRARTLKAFLA